MVLLKLDEASRLVIVQFSFSNSSIIPELVSKRAPETKVEAAKRNQQASGFLVIEPCENVSIDTFVVELEAAGYVLVDGVTQTRQHQNKPGQSYHMVRFVFARSEHAEVSDHFKSVQSLLRMELQDITETAFWRVRAFSNPFYKDGEEIDGVRAISINCEARVPRFLPDGQLVKSRRKDAQGNKVGEPVPIEPARRLSISDKMVELVA